MEHKRNSFVATIARISGHLFFWAFIILFCNGLEWRWGFFSTEGEQNTLLIPSLYGSLFNALIFYLHAFVLYVYRRRARWIYPAGVSVLLGVSSIIETFIDYYYVQHFVAEPFNTALQQVMSDGPQLTESAARILLFSGMLMEVLMVHIVFYVFSFAYLLPRQDMLNRRIQEELQREKLITELKYLKAQINPHFLFNGINSIYHLIDDQPKLAKDVLLTFSSLLRYQLYECSEDSIGLAKELAHLKDYIALEKVRKGEDAVVRVTLPDEVDPALHIAPLLLSPFVENAFKYLSNYDEAERNCLRIEVQLRLGRLYMEVENTYDLLIDDREEKGRGIGLENVRKRLQMLYPESHRLHLSRAAGVYTVQLEVDLQ